MGVCSLAALRTLRKGYWRLAVALLSGAILIWPWSERRGARDFARCGSAADTERGSADFGRFCGTGSLGVGTSALSGVGAERSADADGVAWNY